MTKTIYPYIRFSSSEQRKGDSLRRQLESITKYAEENGYEVNEQYELIDLAVSGYTGANRQEDAGLGRFLVAIEKGLIPTDGTSHLAIEQLDRLSREEIDISFSLFREILRHDVNIITLMDCKIYTKDSLKSITDIIYSLSIMQQSHIESEKKSLRIKASFEGRLQKLKQGKKAKYASQLPSWIDETPAKSGTFIINEKANVIKRIFEMAISDIPLNQIAIILNEESIPRITRSNYTNTNGIWTGSIISHIIKNKCTIGTLELKKYTPVKIEEKNGRTGEITERIIKRKVVYDTIENYYPPIISETDFLVANNRVKDRRVTRERGRNTTNNLFTSLIYCGYCKQRMHFEVDKKELKSGTKIYRNLKCTTARFKKGSCPSRPVNYDNFEKEFPLDFFIRTEIEELADESRTEALNTEFKDLESKLIKKEDKISVLERKILDENLDILNFISIINAMKEECKVIKDKLERVRFEIADIESDRSKPKKLVTAGDREATKRKLKSLLAGIVVYSNSKVLWFMLKAGGMNAVKYERDGNLLDNISDQHKFEKDIKESYMRGDMDPKLMKIAHSLIYD